MATQFNSIIPVLRLFDIAKAKEFYLDFLGFTLDWEHRFEENSPIYLQISKGNIKLHLSEHHGDSSPGAHIRVMMSEIEPFHKELIAKQYRYMKPGLEETPWHAQEMCVIDPFGNKITFCQDKGKDDQA